jgi:hypothetical protein
VSKTKPVIGTEAPTQVEAVPITPDEVVSGSDLPDMELTVEFAPLSSLAKMTMERDMHSNDLAYLISLREPFEQFIGIVTAAQNQTMSYNSRKYLGDLVQGLRNSFQNMEVDSLELVIKMAQEGYIQAHLNMESMQSTQN